MLQEHLRIPERGVLLLERFHRARQKPGLFFRRCECGLGPARQSQATESKKQNQSLHSQGFAPSKSDPRMALDLELGVEYAEMEEGDDPEDHWPE